ncbi:transcriptional regulator, TetR family [Peribacillus simplex]|uniref:Transcriptional regulator, TetR family n=1 Tax=Peribacillus simplex TaxID=1478 RepID=A0A9X8RDY2_9BACI|nr:TetR/AcrR family transcriptional regulator [Peribacillus simplex]SIS03684.1 transcriptional regulator, TetR family [Peribacillus simplex]
MYEGNNPIAIQSQNWLIDALLSLMKEKPYKKISIRDICDKADLSRQTFYNCFKGKDDILRFCLKQGCKAMFQELATKKNLKMKDITDSFSVFSVENAVLLQLMLDHHLENIITDELSTSISACAAKSTPDTETHACTYGIAFFTGALTRVLFCWLQEPQRISSEELSKLLLEIFSGNYYNLDLT